MRKNVELELLKKARKMIDEPEKWTRGTYYFYGRYCLVGAIRYAEGVGDKRMYTPQLIRVCRLLSPRSTTGKRAISRVIERNDSSSHSELLAWLDRAIRRVEKKKKQGIA